jgi:phage baseplate assembly protein W
MADRSLSLDPRAPAFLDYPYRVGGNGTPRLTAAEDHLHDLIVQVLLTSPGERVNLPEFGVGVQRLVFAGNSDALRASTRFLVTTSLERWLGDRIKVEEVLVTSEPNGEEFLVIDIGYSLRATGRRQRFQLRVGL